MSDSAFLPIMRSQPLALPRGVTLAIAWFRELGHRPAGADDPAEEVFLAAGVTDRELVRLSRRGDIEEIARRQRTALWKQAGAHLHHI